jgi:hypothetical protein
MRPRFTREQILRWLAESERVCAEAEGLVIAEGGSRESRALLGIAMVLRAAAIQRALDTAEAFELPRRAS